MLIEPDIVNYINDIKNKGAIVLALTSMESGSYGVIESMPIWRYTMLKDMGIEFSKYFADTIFTRFSEYRSNYPVLYKGILCANQQNKGEVLDAFLTYAAYKPSKVISFDDDFSALQSIGKVCQQHKIPCVLFNYHAKKLQGTWDYQRALQQFKYLINEHRWVSDVELA